MNNTDAYMAASKAAVAHARTLDIADATTPGAAQAVKTAILNFHASTKPGPKRDLMTWALEGAMVNRQVLLAISASDTPEVTANGIVATAIRAVNDVK